jgi:hypothetical protein
MFRSTLICVLAIMVIVGCITFAAIRAQGSPVAEATYMCDRMYKTCASETISPVHAVVANWVTSHPRLVYVDTIVTPRYGSRKIINLHDDFMEYRIVGYDITIIYRKL